MHRIVLALMVASCTSLFGIAVYRTVEAARYALTPEETTLLLVYSIPKDGLRKVGGAYLLEWTEDTAAGPVPTTLMKVRRNQGCRVEIERSSVDRVDETVTNIDTTIYDWSKIDVDQITVSQETVPNQGYAAYYRTIKAPGKFIGSRVLRKSDSGVKIVQPGDLTEHLDFRWAYAPGLPNAYAMNREPFMQLMRKCTGRMPELPEALGSPQPYHETITNRA